MQRRSVRNRTDPGAVVARAALTTIRGSVVSIPDDDALVHLQFRRFAGCPICDLHLSSFARRHQEIDAAGIREVVVFHSTTAALLPFAADLPFAVIADPDKWLYGEFGVEAAPRALLDARAWGAMLLGLYRSARKIVQGAQPVPSLSPAGGRFGLPADFLIDRDGVVIARRYGAHAYDQWSVDQLLALTGSQRAMAGHAVPG